MKIKVMRLQSPLPHSYGPPHEHCCIEPLAMNIECFLRTNELCKRCFCALAQMRQIFLKPEQWGVLTFEGTEHRLNSTSDRPHCLSQVVRWRCHTAFLARGPHNKSGNVPSHGQASLGTTHPPEGSSASRPSPPPAAKPRTVVCRSSWPAPPARHVCVCAPAE